MALRCPLAIKSEISRRSAVARLAIRAGEDDTAWQRLEEAHILSQPWPVPHVTVHLQMLGLASRRRLLHEVLGQVFRVVVAGPGSVVGRYPEGNTGRANVSAFEPMPMPEDLRSLLERHSS